MALLSRYIAAARSGDLDDQLTSLYGAESLVEQRNRMQGLLRRHERWCGDGRSVVVSAPGRTELGGNHTDHNSGVVLAASVSFDCLAVATPTDTGIVRIKSEGFPGVIEVDLADTDPVPAEQNTSEALIRGVADGFVWAGYDVGSFDACMVSDVPVGAGLSSSAAFEVCVGQIFNRLYNRGNASPLELARIGRRAENIHFGKPCGLMDQLACAAQGVLSIDFKYQNEPVVNEVAFDFESTEYQLMVVDTGGSHADLTPDYASIPEELGRAADVFDLEVARGLTVNDVMTKVRELRDKAGDRGVLRLLHFIEESDRALAEAEALRRGDMAAFLELVRASGDSSWQLLQNCISTVDPLEQPIPLALSLTERFLGGRGAWRIHGGGFAGTIQAYVPREVVAEYTAFMEGVFGRGTVIPLRIRKPGHEVITVARAGEEA